jgi:hypothetical protein
MRWSGASTLFENQEKEAMHTGEVFVLTDQAHALADLLRLKLKRLSGIDWVCATTHNLFWSLRQQP